MKINVSDSERQMLKASLWKRKIFIDTDECKTAADKAEVKAINSFLKKIAVPAEDARVIGRLKAVVFGFLSVTRYGKNVEIKGDKLVDKEDGHRVAVFTGVGLRFPGADYPGTDPVLNLGKGFWEKLGEQLMSFY